MPDQLAAALLALGILDHRLSTRDRYTGTERDIYIASAVRDAQLALDGATIEAIMKASDRPGD